MSLYAQQNLHQEFLYLNMSKCREAIISVVIVVNDIKLSLKLQNAESWNHIRNYIKYSNLSITAINDAN